MDLSVSFLDWTLAGPVWNASGPRCTTLEELKGLGESSASVVLSKSCTLEARAGNPQPRFASFEGGSINSMGLPNLGADAYKEMFPTLAAYGKPVIASVSGMKLEDNLTIAESYNESDALGAIELNLSCPNLVGKPQVAYDFDQSAEVLERFAQVCKKPFGVKLPPYFDFAHFDIMAGLLNGSAVRFVTCINSPGNGLVIDLDREQTLIRPKGGFGGIGGRVIKPFGLSNVHKFRELLRNDIQIVGVGGIENGTDVFEYILAGADAVQVGTALWHEGPDIFERLETELKQLMAAKGYTSLEQFRGKLKVI
jgi:dihydroorotate dehydrogenase (fumarate)